MLKRNNLLGLFILAFLSSTIAESCPPKQLTYTLVATPWTTCTDFTNFVCRNVTVPRVYGTPSNAKEVGTLWNLERRIVVGTPKTYVFLFSGGPGGNADILSLAVVPQVSEALINNYAVHVPSLRGTAHTEFIPDYPDLPTNFSEYLSESSLPYEVYTLSNVARDVISTVKAAKAEFPSARFVSAGFSFGTSLIQRILLFEPDLFDASILDGPIPLVNGSNQFQLQSVGLESVFTQVAENCARSEFCQKTSLPLASLTNFVDGLYNGITNPCVDAFVNAISPGVPPSLYASQIVASFARSLALTSNINIPIDLFFANAKNTTVQQEFIQAAIVTFQNVRILQNHIYLDFRVILWALLNQLAQCDSTSRLTTFGQAFQTLGLILSSVSTLGPFLISNISPLGNQYVTQDLELLSEGRVPPTDFEAIQQAQSTIPVRNPISMNQAETAALSAFSLLSSFTDCYFGQEPQNIQGDIVFLEGLLDPNAPRAGSIYAFNSISLAPGFTKKNYTHNNAGHTVISLGWSNCSYLLMRGFFLKNQVATQSYIDCLNAENAQPLDWAAESFVSALGQNIWTGLPSCGQCDPKGYCYAGSCVCLPGYNGNGKSCSPNARTLEVAPFKPIVRYLFDGNNLDSTGKGNTANTGSYTYSSFYQNNDPNDQAIWISSIPVVSSSFITLPNEFTIQVIFNPNKINQFDIFSLVPTPSSPTSQSLVSVSVNPKGRIEVFHYSGLLRTTSRIIEPNRTYNLVVTVRYTQLVAWLDDEKVIDIAFHPPSQSQFYFSIGNDFNGYVDEAGVYGEPINPNQVTSFDKLLACPLSCADGEVCYLTATGPNCGSA